MTELYPVRYVAFARPWREGDRYGWDWPQGRYVADLGLDDAAVHTLRLRFMRGEDLDPLVPFVFGVGPITTSQVDWKHGRFILNPEDR